MQHQCIVSVPRSSHCCVGTFYAILFLWVWVWQHINHIPVPADPTPPRRLSPVVFGVACESLSPAKYNLRQCLYHRYPDLISRQFKWGYSNYIYKPLHSHQHNRTHHRKGQLLPIGSWSCVAYASPNTHERLIGDNFTYLLSRILCSHEIGLSKG